MKKIILILLTAPLILFAQHSKLNLECRTCHSCDIPTKENPCLIDCPREELIRIDQKPEEAPRIIKIDKIKEKNLYEPSIFDHYAHSDMSVMSGDCRICHHYNPPGNIISCSKCHSPQRKRNDISKPDLKAAYHRLCISCHREWSGEVECVSCHAPAGSQKNESYEAKEKKSIHPEIKAPVKKVYTTDFTDGKLVTFYHEEHNKTFGYKCSDCHRNESCVKCHAVNKSALKASPVILHSKCSKCHDTEDVNSCAVCHAKIEKPPFNHKQRAGFDISKFHSDLKCSRCHVTKGKFTGLKKECKSCHGIWTVDNFDHKATGLILDEVHVEFECENCHQEPTYRIKSCDNCHDDKSYPKDKPGEAIKR
ncbi:MAG: cytochrome c3 family protein [Melioribacter sp.]|uniref:cytochrome c3 family protein n=1 Tax=Melioribacter sp. TaxID=2052167 RepID=UPI003BCE2195